MTAKARGPVINSAKIQVLSLGVTKPHKYDNIWAQAGERDLKLQRKKRAEFFSASIRGFCRSLPIFLSDNLAKKKPPGKSLSKQKLCIWKRNYFTT